jgi:hypothetical protein
LNLKDPPTMATAVMITACSCMIAGIILECFTTVRSTHLLDEFFGAAITLYGGHMFVNKATTTTTSNQSYQSNGIPKELNVSKD